MKRQIRYGLFETNSSSVHSLTVCSKEEYKKFEDGKMFYWYWEDRFITPEEVKKMFPSIDFDNATEEQLEDTLWAEGIYRNEEEYHDEVELETFKEEYTSKSGDDIVVFGCYGYEG